MSSEHVVRLQASEKEKNIIKKLNEIDIDIQTRDLIISMLVIRRVNDPSNFYNDEIYDKLLKVLDEVSNLRYQKNMGSLILCEYPIMTFIKTYVSCAYDKDSRVRMGDPCVKCKSTNTVSSTRQMRSGDEAASTLTSCRNCQYIHRVD